MKISQAVAVLGALALSASCVQATGPCGAAGDFTDKFEDLKPAPALAPELSAPPTVPYNGLKYDMVNVNTGNPVVDLGSIREQSPKQVVALFITNNVFSGNPSLNPYFSISSLPGTPKGARTFELVDFYFGCVIPALQTMVNVAGACDISVTGIKENGEVAGELPFSFTPTSLKAANPMTRANVKAQALTGDYVGLTSVNITITRAVGAGAVGILLVDNVRHVNRC